MLSTYPAAFYRAGRSLFYVKMRKILFISSGYSTYPNEAKISDKFKCLSKHFNGQLYSIVPDRAFRRYALYDFTLKGIYLPGRIRINSALRNVVRVVSFTLMAVYSHYFEKKFDVIVALDPLGSGTIALLISKLTGVKTIIEVGGNFESSFILSSENSAFYKKLKDRLSKILIPFILNRANGVKLVYKDQLRYFAGLLKHPDKYFCFANFVPVSNIKPSQNSLKYILFLGFPWYLKGVDILIMAFDKISGDFPEYTLKIVGHCPDKSFFEKFVNRNKRIELCDAVWHKEALKLMEECSLFVLPSRTDSLPRVLREAMAAKKPIIASDVDGIPTIVNHGYNGLLFKSEDVDDLAEKMRKVLGDKSYAQTLAQNGYEYVHANLSEENYIKNYVKMVEKVLNG